MPDTQVVSFRIMNLEEPFLSELRSILRKVFGDDARLTEDGVVSVTVPAHWDTAAVIAMIKTLFSSYELKYATRPGLRI
jgi:hypothetical protein